MKKKFVASIFLLLALIFALVYAVYINSDKIVMLNPKGLVALKERNLMLKATVLMLIVVIPVFILTFFICWKYRAGNKEAEYRPDWNHSYLAECVWWGFPFIIISLLSYMTWKSSHELDPYKPLDNPIKPLKIEVIALEWKWLFIYPELGIATVNYFHFPEKVPLNFQLSADAPMNSFWIPQLGGQIYAMPAMVTKLHLIADEIGEYRGSSANISGVGFAGMTFKAKATSQEDFDQWVESIKSSSPILDHPAYIALAEPSQHNKEASYTVKDNDLFGWIVMRTMTPEKNEKVETNKARAK